MKIKFDFQLSHHFGVIEKIVFKLVLNGFTDSHEIREALPVFSDIVIANGIKKLVNKQILNIGTVNGKLSLSEPIRAIICSCLEKTYELDMAENIYELISAGGVRTDIVGGKTANDLKLSILNALVPNVNLHLFRDSLDIILLDGTRGDEIG